jgi:hypothetical protein
VNRPLLWFHGDSLHPDGVVAQAWPESPRVFVFDREFLSGRTLSFKRLFFLYECARECGCRIRVGSVVEEILAEMREQGCDGVVTQETESPRFHALVARLREETEVTILDEEPLVRVDPGWKVLRFSRFWEKVGGEWSDPSVAGPFTRRSRRA